MEWKLESLEVWSRKRICLETVEEKGSIAKEVLGFRRSFFRGFFGEEDEELDRRGIRTRPRRSLGWLFIGNAFGGMFGNL